MRNSFLAPTSDAGHRRQEETRLCLAAAELALGLMAAKKVDQNELARRLGCTKGHVSQLLSGDHNMTLRTLAGIVCALGERVDLHSESERHNVRWVSTTPYAWNLPSGRPRQESTGNICIAA